jgi:type II secretory pathway pseudopilin PulG
MTLIEILIVMTILIILAALAAAGARVALNITRNNATKVLLAQIQTALDEKMQKFIMDTQANQPIDNYALLSKGTAPLPPSSTPGQRAAIIARMDSMRSAFPQSFAEMVPPSNTSAILNAASPTVFFSEIATALTTPGSGSALAPIINQHPSHTSLLIAYLKGSGQITNSGEFTTKGGYSNVWLTNFSGHDPQTESAECLYLILSDRTGSTTSIIDELPDQFIKDTDNDGLLEIVDSWGKPVKFYRWATDTFAYFSEITQQYKGVGKPGDVDGDGVADTILGSNSLDPSNLLYTDGAWFNGSSVTTVGGFSANEKDLFESLFGRLHGAYSFAHSGANLTSLTPNLDTDADAIAYNPINNRNEHEAAWSGASGTPWAGLTLGYQVPRSYPFRSLVVSAGADGKFGMYDLESQTPNTGGTVGVTYPQIHIGYKCGRVEDDLTKRPDFNDNVFSVELQEGIKQ